MTLPFTAPEFFRLFARYNLAVWPAQIALIGLAIAVLALVFARPLRSVRAIPALLALLWAWSGVAYHLAFFSEINPAAPLFGALFLAGAAAFAWEGVVRARLRFECTWNARCATGIALVAYALIVYPLLASQQGRGYPAMATFGLPCPTTLFTFGVLAFLRPPYRPYVFVAPLLWAAVGTLGALLFGIHEDLGLAAAGLAGALFALYPARRA
jgi:hypothetical protein